MLIRKNLHIFAILFRNRMLGSIAQLVQSVCLTSRGSGVRLPLLPRKKRSDFPVASFVMMKVETPGPLLGGISRASENGVSEGNAGRRCPKQAEACFGMPRGAVAQRLGDRRKGPGVPGPGVRLPLLTPKKT